MMKVQAKYIALFCFLFWLALYAFMFWILRALVLVGGDFSVGVIGGAVWAYFAGKVYEALAFYLHETRDEFIKSFKDAQRDVADC